MLSGYSPKTRLSALGSCHCVHHTFTHLSFLFFILWTRRKASFAQLIPAISIVVFSLLHYANWIGSIPAQIISSCQKDYHIIKGETLLNFNQPGLITMYMQMLNFTSFFSAPSGPWSFSPRWNSLITHLWLWLPSLKSCVYINIYIVSEWAVNVSENKPVLNDYFCIGKLLVDCASSLKNSPKHSFSASLG